MRNEKSRKFLNLPAWTVVLAVVALVAGGFYLAVPSTTAPVAHANTSATDDADDVELLDEEAAKEAEDMVEGDDKPYRIECYRDEDDALQCDVDRDTYVGWRTYHGQCMACHGQDAVGSTFAPNLVRRVQEITEARFMTVVAGGIQTEDSNMPAFADNPNVWPRIQGIYSYLQARADGELPPGRPGRLPEED